MTPRVECKRRSTRLSAVAIDFTPRPTVPGPVLMSAGVCALKLRVVAELSGDDIVGDGVASIVLDRLLGVPRSLQWDLFGLMVRATAPVGGGSEWLRLGARTMFWGSQSGLGLCCGGLG